MECMSTSHHIRREVHTAVPRYDQEKIARIRQRIAEVFGRASTWDDAKIAERYNITPDGDLIMILK